ncbi:MAG: hypothetical protein HQL64_16145 [Magnetococcales bacterium]|nr:hypothetical protein [Magnetococcales bacterium]
MEITSSTQIGATSQMEQTAKSQGAVGNQTDQKQTAVSADRQGSSYPVQKDTVDFAKAPPAPVDKGAKVEGEKTPPPPPLKGGQKGPGQKVDSAKVVGDGVLRPWSEASANQIQIPGVASGKEGKTQVEIQTTSEPVAKAIREKVNNLFKVYPNGGQSHKEKVEVPFTKSSNASAVAASVRKQATSVDAYA